jgi:hypothetical protein
MEGGYDGAFLRSFCLELSVALDLYAQELYRVGILIQDVSSSASKTGPLSAPSCPAGANG